MAGLRRNAPEKAANDKQRAVAFVNWALPLQGGKVLKASKGFAIFQNPQYPNKHEDMLVELAKRNGGTAEVMLKCRIMINQSQDPSEINLDDIVLLPSEDTAPMTEPVTAE